MKNREARLKEIFTAAFNPQKLEIENHSSKHRGHSGDDGTGETHFDVLIISDRFTGKSRPARHRAVYDLCDEEFKTGLHALSLILRTPEEEGG